MSPSPHTQGGEPRGAEAPRANGPLLGAVAFTVLAWASAFVVIRSVGSEVDPGPLAAGRLLVGMVILWALQARRGWVAPNAAEWRRLLVYGIGWFGIYNVALNAGEQHLDAGTSAMVVNVGPILIALLAAVLLGERLTRWLGLGTAIAFAGAVVIGLATRGSAQADVTGVALCLAAAATYAVGVICQKQVLTRLPATQVTAVGCTIGAIACLPFVPGLLDDLSSASTSADLAVLYLGIVPTALAFSTWAYALGRMDAGRLGVTTYLVPPVAALGGWLFLDEIPPTLAFAGGALCLLGVAVSRRAATPAAPTPQAGPPAPNTEPQPEVNR
ncbi:MAG: DMT family transporter [Solirubrobacteraceae bacterium]|nr:DMT family transporter [Solirubrobacteraceae bacterium]